MKPALWWLLAAIACWVASFVLLIHEDSLYIAALLIGVLAGVQAVEEQKS